MAVVQAGSKRGRADPTRSSPNPPANAVAVSLRSQRDDPLVTELLYPLLRADVFPVHVCATMNSMSLPLAGFNARDHAIMRAQCEVQIVCTGHPDATRIPVPFASRGIDRLMTGTREHPVEGQGWFI